MGPLPALSHKPGSLRPDVPMPCCLRGTTCCSSSQPAHTNFIPARPVSPGCHEHPDPKPKVPPAHPHPVLCFRQSPGQEDNTPSAAKPLLGWGPRATAVLPGWHLPEGHVPGTDLSPLPVAGPLPAPTASHKSRAQGAESRAISPASSRAAGQVVLGAGRDRNTSEAPGRARP